VEAGPKRERLDAFLREAAIPAWNRIGIEHVGVFEAMDGKSADLRVVLAYSSLEAFATATRRLLADADFLKAGAAWLDLPKKDPLFKRIESSLMLAFDECPRVEVHGKKEGRVFQLRTYESHSLKKGQKKVEMFNAGGEIAIFRRCGMQPVFFGETLAGALIPNLTYMLVFDDMAAKDAAWKKFLGDPAWKKLAKDPAYKDTVSRITNTLLRPTPYSQL